ncbi:MAG: AbrB family transcriptional regulator [Gammaproteobacteria bacterium]|nr:AbrB family transcriptional regulator [Gammaproteobacteria bacterium]
MIQSSLTSKCRTTLPKAVRDALAVSPGDRLRYVILENNEVRILPTKPVSRLFGYLRYDGPEVSLQDMDNAIAEGACDL